MLDLYVNGDLDMDALIRELMEVTPAHLWIDLNMTFARVMKLQTRSGDSSFLMWLCGEHPCGDIPYPYTVDEPYYIGVGAKTGNYDANNYYGNAGDGYKSGELRDLEESSYIYVQNFGAENRIDFGGDD